MFSRRKFLTITGAGVVGVLSKNLFSQTIIDTDLPKSTQNGQDGVYGIIAVKTGLMCALNDCLILSDQSRLTQKNLQNLLFYMKAIKNYYINTKIALYGQPNKILLINF